MRPSRIAHAAVCSLILAAVAQAQMPEAAALPEGNEYVRSVLKGARPQDAAINDFSYDLEETRENLDKDGRASSRETKRYEVYFVKTRPVRRQVSRNGAPLSAKDQAEVDRKAKAQADAISGGKTVSEQAGIRLALLLDSFDFKTVGREKREGRTTLVFEFKPRANPERPSPANRAAEALTRILAGRLHIDETDRRVVRLQASTPPGKNASVAFGVKVQTFELLMEFTTVEDGVWLPRQVVTVTTGKAFLFKTFRVRQTTTYSNYRRFSVDTEEQPKD